MLTMYTMTILPIGRTAGVPTVTSKANEPTQINRYELL